MTKVPIGRIQAAQNVACSTCRRPLSESQLELAIQGKTVRCSGCRADIKLPPEVQQQLRKARQKQ